MMLSQTLPAWFRMLPARRIMPLALLALASLALPDRAVLAAPQIGRAHV